MCLTPGESADYVSQPKTISTFTKCGSISLEKQALRIEITTFNQKHVAYISVAGIRQLIGPTQMPADVEEIRTGIDGTEVTQAIGRAWRSRSGRALVIRVPYSSADLMVPWSQFRKVLDRKVQKAAVSTFTPPDKPRPRPSNEAGNSMNAGLAGGF